MAERGARPDRVRAYLGPAVAPERYQVDAAVRHALADAVRPADLDPAVARADGPDHWLVDLVAANRQQLVGRGVRPEHISASGVDHRRRGASSATVPHGPAAGSP